MASDTQRPDDDLDDTGIPVLEDVVVPGIESAPEAAEAAQDELLEGHTDEPLAETIEITAVPEDMEAFPEPATVDVQALAATVEHIAVEMRAELERKFRGVVALAVEEALARSLRQYEEHVRLSILSHLLEHMPEILAAASHDHEHSE
jgi:hypothetical protein